MDQFTCEVELAIMSINERIEQATGPDYDELNDAMWETELLCSAVVSVEDQLPIGGGEIIGAIQRVLSSIQELKDVCQRRHVRGRPQISIEEDQLEFLLELHFSPSYFALFFRRNWPAKTKDLLWHTLFLMYK